LRELRLGAGLVAVFSSCRKCQYIASFAQRSGNRACAASHHPLPRRSVGRFDSGTLPAETPTYSNFNTKGDDIMPYLLGWLLGVPLIVLVILYLIFH
jgi:hypothetical protein